MTVANCPACGGQVTFDIGSSIVVVCEHCHSLVARTDRGLEDLGKVAALIDTGSPLRRGITGKYRGIGFRVVGRTQMHHEAGGVWDEWYAAFDDGRWGWLAEAQGRQYITFEVATPAPAFESLELGMHVAEIDGMTVAEIGQGRLASAEGEIPWKPSIDSTYLYADLSGAEGRFATIDYSDSPPTVFKGSQTSLAELGIAASEPRREQRVGVQKLSCSNCGGALALVAPDQSQRIICPYCGAVHDVTEGKLRYLQVLKQPRVRSSIALGKTGVIEGDTYVVAGYMQRAVTIDDTSYFWLEYLLFNLQKGFRWLVESEHHWSFVTPVPPGDVTDLATGDTVAPSVGYHGKAMRLFQASWAWVTFVTGEFYWRVEVGERVLGAEYIAPPAGISKEISSIGREREVNYSYERYATVEEIEQAFGLKGLPRPNSIGTLQPGLKGGLGKMWLAFLAALIFITLGIAASLPRRGIFDLTYNLTSTAVEWSDSHQPQRSQTFFTQPFELGGGRNLMIEASAPIDNHWIYVAGDIINEDSGQLDSFSMPIEHYGNSGDDEEGSRDQTVYLSSMPKGRYSMRMEVQWEGGTTPPPLHVVVREGVFRSLNLILALIALTILPIIGWFRRVQFESARWREASTNLEDSDGQNPPGHREI